MRRNPRSTGSAAAAEAKKLLEKMNITSAPVPVDEIAKQMGAILRYSALDDELSGMVFINDGQAIIGVNSLHHPNRQRFTIAHELGHLVLHKETLTATVHVDKQFKILMRQDQPATGDEQYELEANQFAAELLIPEAILQTELEHFYEIDEELPIEELARKFRVSKMMFSYRLMNIGFTR